MILDACFEILKFQDLILNFQILFNIRNIELKLSKHIRRTCLMSVALKIEDTALIWMLTSAKKTKRACKCKMLSLGNNVFQISPIYLSRSTYQLYFCIHLFI